MARGLPRDTENISVYWENFASRFLLKSAFLVSNCYVIKHTSNKLIKEDHQEEIARPVCLLKSACVGAPSEENMVQATHLMRKVQPFRFDCTLFRIKQILVLKNG